MKKLLITAAFLLFITGTALAANKVQDLRSGPDSREPQTVEAQTIGARNTGAQTIYPGQNSAAETSETGGWESMTVRDKPMALEAALFLGRNREVAQEMLSRQDMAGRLIIPSAGIDVALFIDGQEENVAQLRQEICDREDSAAFFTDGLGMLIADHNNQAFSLLSQVQTGDKAVILRGHSIVTLECDLLADGNNYGKGILDEEGFYFTSYEDYICYTCKEDWNNVLVAGFKVLDEDYII